MSEEELCGKNKGPQPPFALLSSIFLQMMSAFQKKAKVFDTLLITVYPLHFLIGN